MKNGTLIRDLNDHQRDLNSTNRQLSELRKQLKNRVEGNLKYRQLDNQRAMLESRLSTLKRKLAETGGD